MFFRNAQESVCIDRPKTLRKLNTTAAFAARNRPKISPGEIKVPNLKTEPAEDNPPKNMATNSAQCFLGNKPILLT